MTGLRLVKRLNHSPTAWLLLFLAGGMIQVATSTWWEGLLIVAGAVCINIAMSQAVNRVSAEAEKQPG